MPSFGRFVIGAVLLPLLAAAAPIPSTPDLGKAEGKCRPGESGPAFLVHVNGLKDRTGRLKLEVYPANDKDFLADDNVLVAAGKTFRRVEVDVPGSGAPVLCVRVPAAGAMGCRCSTTAIPTAGSAGAWMGSASPPTPSWDLASPRPPGPAPARAARRRASIS